jgi:predicted  nucleic acid-binding Zn-ribbon protein
MSLQDDLRKLFALDTQLRGMRTRLDNATGRVKRQQTKLDQLNRQLAELVDQHKHAMAKAITAEKTAKEGDEKVEHLREQMNNAKNNKEYEAMRDQIATLKLEKGKTEDEAIKQMEKSEQLAAQVAAAQAAAAEQAKAVALAENEVKESRAELGTRLDELTVERDNAAKIIPEKMLAEFNKIADIHDGEAMAPVVVESHKHREYSCGGCQLSLPVERVSSLMRVNDYLITCTNCGRILFIEKQTFQTAPAK